MKNVKLENTRPILENPLPVEILAAAANKKNQLRRDPRKKKGEEEEDAQLLAMVDGQGEAQLDWAPNDESPLDEPPSFIEGDGGMTSDAAAGEALGAEPIFATPGDERDGAGAFLVLGGLALAGAAIALHGGGSGSKPAAATSYNDDVGAVQSTHSTAPTTDDTTPGLNIGAGLTDPRLYVDGVQVAADYDPATGTLTPSDPLAEGAHELRYTVSDAAGNESAKSDPITITVDTTVPPTPGEGALSLIDDVGAVQGPIAKGGITDDARPTFSGTADAGEVAYVNVYDGTQLLGSAQVQPDGTWSFEPALPLASGPHNLIARPVDAAGNEGPGTSGWNFTLLGDAPAVPVITSVTDDHGSVQGPLQKGDSTDDATPTLSGAGTAGTTVKVYADGVEVGSAVVGSDGTWTVTTSALGADGIKNLTAQAIDGAGQSSPMTGAYPIVLDTSAPTKPAVPAAHDDQGATQGPIANGSTTDDTAPTFSGSGEPGSTVKLYDGANLLGTAQVQPDSTWSFTPTTPLADGAHSITTTLTDAAGNTSSSSDPLAFTIDTTNVTVTISRAIDDAGPITGNIAGGGTTDDTTPTLVGTATPNATVTVKDGSTVLGTATADGTGAWSFTLPAQSQGVHTYTAEAKNAAGTTGSTTFGLNIDTTAPAVPGLGDVQDDVGTKQGSLVNGASTDDTTPTLSGAGATPGDTINVYDNGQLVGSTQVQPDGTWSYTPTTPLTEGDHALTVSAVDPAGNESGKSPALTINVDTTAPGKPAAATSYNDNVGAVQNAHSTAATTDDGTPGLNVGTGLTDPRLYVDGAEVPATYDPVTGTLTPNAPLAEGAHELSYTVSDAAGNESPRSDPITITVDTTVPPALGEGALALTDDVGAVQGPIAKGSMTDDARPTFSGTADASQVASVNVYDGAQLLGSAQVHPDGTWSFEPALPLASGPHNLVARPVDAAGNEGPGTSGWNFTLLGDAPAVPAITSVTDDQGAKQGPLQKGDSTDDATPTLSGTGTVGTTVKVYADGAEVGSAVVASDGTWTVTTSALGADGIKNLTAQAIDGAGQSSPMTGAYPIVLDTSAPAKPAVPAAHDDQGATQGPIANGSTTDDTAPTFSGSGEPGSTVKIYDGANLLGTAQVQPNGTWSFTPTTPLADGAHSITTTLTDAAGNTSSSSDALAFTVDTSDVTVTIGKALDDHGSKQGDVAAGGVTDDTTPTLVGTATAGAVVTIKEGAVVLGTATADGTGAWSFTLPAQSQGVHTYTAEAKNAAGTTGSTTFGLNIDTTAPAVPGLGDVQDDVGTKQGSLVNGASTDDTTPTLSGAGATPGDTINIYDNGQLVGSTQVNPDGTWSYTPTTPLTEGEHALTVSAVDPAGNESGKSPALTINVDTTAPAKPAAATSYNDNVGAVQNAHSTAATTDDGTPGLNVGTGLTDPRLYVDGAEVPATYDPVTGTLTPNAPLAEGAHELRYTVSDAAGNESPRSDAITITVDTTTLPAPAAPTSYDDNAAPVIDAHSTAPSTNDTTPGINVGTGLLNPKLYVNGTEVASTYNPTTGTLTPNIPLGDGTYNLTYTHANAAGVDSAQSAPLVLTVDTAAPVAGTLSLANFTDTGASATDGLTQDKTFDLSLGGQEAGGTVAYEVSTDGGSTWTATTAAQANLADGSYRFRARVTDAGGNTATSNVVSVTVDATGPSVTPLTASATEDAPVATHVNLLQGASDANGGLTLGGITYTVDGVATGSGGTALPAGFSLVGNQLVADTTHASFDTLAAGQSRTVVASYQVIDAAGNASSQTATVTVNGVNDAPVLGSVSINPDVPGLLPAGPLSGQDGVIQILNLKSAQGYSIMEAGSMYILWSQLNSDTNFGPSGIYPKDVQVIAEPATVTSAWLAQGHVAFDGWTGLASYSEAEVTAIQGWVNAGNVLICTNDYLANPKPLASAFGPMGGGETDHQNWVLASSAQLAASTASYATKAAAQAILNGPFGSLSGGSQIFGQQDTSYFDPSKLLATDIVLAWEEGFTADTRPTIVLRPYGDGYVLLTGDEGLFRGPNFSGAMDSTNEVFAANLFAWSETRLSMPTGAALSSIMPAVTDIDGGSSLKGWAITEAGTGSSGQGHWEYLSGSAWVNLTGASLAHAVFLTPDTLVRWNGDTPSSGPLSAVAVDDTAAIAQGGTLDVTIRGGSTPYSEAMAGLPAMPAGYKDDVGAVQSNASWAAITDDNQPGLNVGAGLSGTVNLYVDGALVAATYDPVAGTLTPNLLLPEGTHQLSYSVTTGGTEGARSPSLTITVDLNNAPVAGAPITVSDLVENEPARVIDLLQGTTDANGDTLSVSNVTYSVNGGAASSSLPAGLALSGTSLTVDTTHSAFDALAAGETKLITANYTISDGNGGAVNQTANLTINGVNDAPVMNNHTIAWNAGLVGAIQYQGTAVTTSPIEGAAGIGNVPAGWTSVSGSPDLNNVNNPIYLGYSLNQVNGASLNGGNFVELFTGSPHESIGTVFNNLTPGVSYLYAVQWQQIELTDGSYAYKGGQLALTINGVSQIYTSAGTADDWQTAFFQFTATNTTANLTVAINGMAGTAVGATGGGIAVDSLTTAQINQLNPVVPSGGVAMASLMENAASDRDNGSSLKGYVVTSAAANGSAHWQYQDGSGNWHDLDGASITGGVFVTADTHIRWTGMDSGITTLDVVAADNTATVGTVGSTLDVSVRGGSTPYSQAIATLSAGTPPVVLDLDQDGVIDYGHVVMDVTGDGVAEHTAWVAASDGVLVWDKYGDAVVHDSSQYAFSQYGGNTDLEGLRAAFDTNGDGLFSADDALFQQFAVWQDLNQNGVSEAGEVRSLADWGIVAIGLASDGQVRYLEGGVTEFGRATATLADGSTMAVADVMFAYGPLLDGAGTAGSAALADVWFDAGMLDSVAGQTAGQPGICLPEPSPQPDGMPPVVQDDHLAATLLANQQAVF